MRWSVSLVVLAVACGGVERPGPPENGKSCSAANCPDGCCDPFGVCRSGLDPSACGPVGGSCTICMGYVRCTNRTCVPIEQPTYDGGQSAGGGSGGFDAGWSAGGGSGGFDAGWSSGGGSGSSGGGSSSGGSSSGGSGPSGELYCQITSYGCGCTYVPAKPSGANPSCTPSSAGPNAKCCSGLDWPNGINGYCGCYKDPATCNLGGLKAETRCN